MFLPLVLFAVLGQHVPDSVLGIDPVERRYVAGQVQSRAASFTTPSDAAYAAALFYGLQPGETEVGAKIYADIGPKGEIAYSFGPLLRSTTDGLTGDPEINYDVSETDGHSSIIGLWHRHPPGAGVETLLGHLDTITETGQIVWTTLWPDLFVQYPSQTIASREPYVEICSYCI